MWAYIAVTVPLVMTPGVSTAVVLRNSVAGGVKAGLVTAVGVNSGSFCYGLLSAFGFALAMQRWPSAWMLLRVAGVLYLAWLGAKSLHRAVLPRPSDPFVDEPPAAGGRWKSLYEGFMTNALNPAIATFYLVLLPQFIPRGAPIVRTALLLTAIHIGLAATWHVVWAASGGTLARTLAGGRPRRWLEAVTGVTLIVLAAKIAIAKV
jgi:threonine/homoserine/homoserine lactone efflux protein